MYFYVVRVVRVVILFCTAIIFSFGPKKLLRKSKTKTGRRKVPRPKPVSVSHIQLGESVEGPVYVIDGDSVVIRKVEIRLFGIDAPELNHPFGQKAKWALVSLCKGQCVTAKVVATDTHGRIVAKCYLPDGSDLSAEMVKHGMAIDWPKFSNGIYRSLEPIGIRKKLWLADARQKGRMHVWKQFEAKQNAGKKDVSRRD